MTSNRVDQVSYPGALQNHERRLRILEAVAPPMAAILPPWFAWTPALAVPVAGMGVQTPPTVYTQFAFAMVQTEDGTPFPDGGTPLGNGTLLGQIKVELADGGTIGDGYNLVPELLLDPSSDSDAYNTLDDSEGATGPTHTIGSGWILQYSTNTALAVQMLGDGRLYVTNLPDLADFSGAAAPPTRNACRLANPYLSPAVDAFPWDWAAGDWISVSYQSPIGIPG